MLVSDYKKSKYFLLRSRKRKANYEKFDLFARYLNLVHEKKSKNKLLLTLSDSKINGIYGEIMRFCVSSLFFEMLLCKWIEKWRPK